MSPSPSTYVSKPHLTQYTYTPSIVNVDKENQSPHTHTKRPNESVSMRKFLKRCRATTPSTLSREDGSEVLVSDVQDSTISNDSSVIEAPRVGLSGGLMLLWKNDVDVTLLNYGSSFFDCYLKNEDEPSFHFIGFYGSPNIYNRSSSLTLLKRLADVAPLSPWLAIGEFNEILSNSNKSGGDPFTWIKNRSTLNTIKERLDRCFVNNHWENNFTTPTVHHLDYYHRIIVLLWLSSTYNQQQSLSINSCVESLQSWHIRKYGKMKKKINACQDKVTNLNNITAQTSSDLIELLKVEAILEDLLEQIQQQN
ncbi:hypothetical protein CsatB_023616 [Cannabis sativa]